MISILLDGDSDSSIRSYINIVVTIDGLTKILELMQSKKIRMRSVYYDDRGKAWILPYETKKWTRIPQYDVRPS
jgi:hypothetical protein